MARPLPELGFRPAAALGVAWRSNGEESGRSPGAARCGADIMDDSPGSTVARDQGAVIGKQFAGVHDDVMGTKCARVKIVPWQSAERPWTASLDD